MTELFTLHQTTELISQSLQALLKHLNPNSTPPVAAEPAPPATAPTPVAPVTLQPWIPHPVLLDAYDGACSGGEQFLQSCLTYIHLSKDAFDSDAAYPNGLQLCLTFWDSLHPALVECIENLAEGCPNDEKIVLWYEVAQD
ncbi:hypothetical protein C0989_010128 [Termitomyces sp. Mn162]|nr:hypothetical protein C0989_010128 [Termitomyces sp. Mn162]